MALHDLFVFPATSIYQSWEEPHPFVGFQPPSIRSRRAAHVQPRARAHSPAVCTRKRRGDEKHVCAMRTGIGVSLFRGGSDVLFHPRRRQSCRTAKTYHTIVSKFTHSLISRSFFRYLSFSVLLFLSPSFRWLSGGSSYLFIFSRFTSTTSFISFSSSSSTSRLLFYSSFAILSLVYPVSAERGLVVRAGKVFRRSVCVLDRKTSDEMRFVSFVGITETIVENDLRAPVMCEL